MPLVEDQRRWGRWDNTCPLNSAFPFPSGTSGLPVTLKSSWLCLLYPSPGLWNVLPLFPALFLSISLCWRLFCFFKYLCIWLHQVLVAALHWLFIAALWHLSSCSGRASVVAVCELSCPVACRILAPQPGVEPISSALEGIFLTTGPPERSLLKPCILSSSSPNHQFSLFSCSVVSDSLWPHGLQHTRAPCLSPTPRSYSNSCPLRRWCHPTISSSVVPFSSCLLSFPASGSFPMSRFFASCGQSIAVSASASALPMNIQDWFPLGLTDWISLQSKGLWRVFSNTTIQKHQFLDAKLSLNHNDSIFPREWWVTSALLVRRNELSSLPASKLKLFLDKNPYFSP